VSKRIAKVVKLELPAGGAKPGSALASAGINMPKFCQEFNDKTRERAGDVVPVIITAFEDKSFSFVIKTTPAAVLLKKAAKVEKASGNALKTKVATISADEVRKIAEYKLPDLNANDVEAAMRIIEGTARNMGIVVEGMPAKK
jgi:large subunit ribosomal protein L11